MESLSVCPTLLRVGVVAWLLDCDCAFSVLLSLSRSSEDAALSAELILLVGERLSGVVSYGEGEEPSGLRARGLGAPAPAVTDSRASS